MQPACLRAHHSTAAAAGARAAPLSGNRAQDAQVDSHWQLNPVVLHQWQSCSHTHAKDSTRGATSPQEHAQAWLAGCRLLTEVGCVPDKQQPHTSSLHAAFLSTARSGSKGYMGYMLHGAKNRDYVATVRPNYSSQRSIEWQYTHKVSVYK
jgi:hypothetical protein